MNAKLPRQESPLQSAINAALDVLADRNGRKVRLLAPYANQQGDRLRNYCADIVGLLDNGLVLLLEVKELNVRKGQLIEFNPKQHYSYLRLEKLGVPVAYAYNTVDVAGLPHAQEDRQINWPSSTLGQINRASPSDLPDETPDVPSHETLHDWFQTSAGSTDAALDFGRAHGAFKKVTDLRTGALVLVYGPAKHKLATLNATAVDAVFNYLTSPTSTTPPQAWDDILQGSQEIRDSFNPPGSTPKRKRI